MNNTEIRKAAAALVEKHGATLTMELIQWAAVQENDDAIAPTHLEEIVCDFVDVMNDRQREDIAWFQLIVHAALLAARAKAEKDERERCAGLTKEAFRRLENTGIPVEHIFQDLLGDIESRLPLDAIRNPPADSAGTIEESAP